MTANTKQPRVLITYIESGKGHIRSMESICQALQDKNVEVVERYIMQEEGMNRLQSMERFLVNQTKNTNKSEFFGKFIFAFINFFGGYKLMNFAHHCIMKKSTAQCMKAFDKYKPDIIVTNHYYLNMMACDYAKRTGAKVVNYNPDNTLHTFWDKRSDAFIVNSQTSYDRAIKFGYNKDTLYKVFPAVRREIEECKLTKSECRQEFGLDEKFTVTLSDGAYMLGRAKRFAKKLLTTKLPINICVIAGYNDKNRAYFQAIADGKGKIKLGENVTLKVYGYLENAHVLYGASDVFVTKGGPNAVLDSVYMRTPVIINYTPHMIEEATAREFGKVGVALKCFSAKKTKAIIEAACNGDTVFDDMRDKIDGFIQRHGADTIADIIEKLARDIGADSEQPLETPLLQTEVAAAD